MRVAILLTEAHARNLAPHPGAAAKPAEPPGPGVALANALAYGVVTNGKTFDADAFTVAAWVKPSSVDGSQVLVSRGAAKQFTLYFFRNRVRMLIQHQPEQYTHAHVPLPESGVWTHYAGTYNGTHLRLFIDGQCVATNPCTGAVGGGTGPLYMGCSDGLSQYFDGTLDEVAMYSLALAESQIGAIYSNGVNHAPAAYPQSVTTTPVYYCRNPLTRSPKDH